MEDGPNIKVDHADAGDEDEEEEEIAFEGEGFLIF